VFRGFSNLALDAKGRLSVPVRYRDPVAAACQNHLVVTVNPWDRCLWLYPAPEWELAEAKLMQLSDADKWDRRTKQILRGYATDCELDGQGRLLLPPELREFATIDREVVMLGQGNRFEIWGKAAWDLRRDEFFEQVDQPAGELSGKLRELSL
jgi:MraZ protein